MRLAPLFAIFLLAGSGAGQAADLAPVPAGGVYSELGARVAPFVMYDFEPGIVVRAYWLPPWRHRHYFPASGEAPVLGRDEDLSSSGSRPIEAETFGRRWSNAPGALSDGMPLPERPLK